MEQKIEEIVNRYYNKADNCINFLRYEGEKEFWIDKEVKNLLQENGITSVVLLTDAYDKCSVCVKVLSVAYIENDELKLYTKKLIMF